MTLGLNASAYLQVDEDQTNATTDETAALSTTFYDSALGALYAALAANKVAATADFTTPQVAVESGLFQPAAGITADLQFSQTANAFTAFGTTAGTGVDSGLTLDDGTHIYLFQSSDPHVVIGTIANDPSAKIALTLAIDEHVTGGSVDAARLWITQYAAILHDGQNLTDANDFRDLANKLFVSATEVTNETFSDFSKVPSGADEYAMISNLPNNAGGAGTSEFLVTAFKTTFTDTTAERVNVSTQGLATPSQNIGVGDGMRFDIVSGGVTTGDYTDAATIAYASHISTTDASFLITQNPGNNVLDVEVRAFNVSGDPQGDAIFTQSIGSEAAVGLDEIIVRNDATNAIIFDKLANGTVLTDTQQGISVDFSSGVAQVHGLAAGMRIEMKNAANTFERFTVANVGSGNDQFDVGGITFQTTVVGSSTVEVGSHVQIEDSGPTIAATGAAGTWTLDDSNLANGTAPNPALTSSTHDLSSAFTHTDGADGATISYSLEVVGGNGTASSLKDGVTGEDILLRVNGAGTVEGYLLSNNQVDFTVSQSGGAVTVTQLHAIHQNDPTNTDESISLAANLIKLDATITDSEGLAHGDSQTAKLSISEGISFKDDAPAITKDANPTSGLQTSDANLNTPVTDTGLAALFHANLGADSGTASTFALGTVGGAAGFNDALTNQAVLIEQQGDKVVGYFVDNLNNHVAVFDLAVNSATGDVTMTQYRAIIHDDPGGAHDTVMPLAAIAGLVTLTATATDGDGDPVSSALDITGAISIADATPAFTSIGEMTGPINLLTGDGALEYVQGATHTDAFTVDFHNDLPHGSAYITPGSLSYSGPLTPVQVSSTEIDFRQGQNGTEFFHLNLTDTGYTVTVDHTELGGLGRLQFDKIPSGPPQELLNVSLSNGQGAMVVNGLIFNPNGKTGGQSTYNNPLSANNDPGTKSTTDDLNPDNLGFGMKGGPGGQASQLNENQGFAIAYNGGGDNADLHDLGFDVQGIGNVNNVDLTYWLYGKGADGVAGTADDVLIDTGKISIADLHLQSLNGGRYAHSVDLFAGVGANSTYAAIAGHDHVLDASDPTFDYAAVRINFPPDNGSPNPGVRVGNFSTETTHVQTPDGFSFTVSIQDVDHDIATSPTANVFLTPVLGAGWLT